MVVGEIAEPVDLLVVGGGPGGYVAALRAAQLGRRVTLVEREGVDGLGGCCLQVGCIPSKALIELAGAVDHVGAMEVAGLRAEGVGADLAQFQEWRRSIVGSLTSGVAGLLERAGVEVIAGEARFNRRDRVAVRTPSDQVRFLEPRQAILATGSRPVALPALPFDGERVLDSTGALGLTAVPASVAVVGTGYIGLELGIAYAKLGAQVTLVEALPRVLPALDEVLTRPVLRTLRRLRVEVLLGTLAVDLEEEGIVVEDRAGERRVIAAERVVVAVGRRPNLDDIGLEQTGAVVGEDGLILVDEGRRATPTLAAVGDLTAGPALAHKASAEGRVAAEALSGLPAAFEPAAVPAVVFSDPEIATTGLSEAEARAAGMEVDVATLPLSASGRAATLGAREGFVRVVVERGGDRIVGVHVVGAHASELIGEGTLAVEMLASPEDLSATIHPHPTMSEGLVEAAAMILGRGRAGPRFTPRADRPAAGAG